MQHPIKHLRSADGEAWIGVLDAIYAVAMTLIAVELPELLRHIIDFPDETMGSLTTIYLLIYLFIAYVATFLLFYELWTLHKMILRLGGLMRQSQNLLNGIIMALSCLAAGNVILIIKAKQEVTAETLKKVSSAHQLLLQWADKNFFVWVVLFITVALMFYLLGMLSRSSIAQADDRRSLMKQMSRNLEFKAKIVLTSLLIWAPMLVGYKLFIEPILFLILFLVFCYFEESIVSWLKKRRSNS